MSEEKLTDKDWKALVEAGCIANNFIPPWVKISKDWLLAKAVQNQINAFWRNQYERRN